MMVLLPNRFEGVLKNIESGVNNREECIEILSNLIIQVSDPQLDEIKLNNYDEVTSCLKLVQLIDKKIGICDDGFDGDQHKDYMPFVIGWALTVAILNRYFQTTNDQEKHQLFSRLTSMRDFLIKYRAFRDLRVMIKILNYNEKDVMRLQLVESLKKRVGNLKHMLNDLMDEKKRLFVVMAIRSMVYIDDNWECTEILEMDILKPLLKTIKESIDFITQQSHLGGNEDEFKYVHLVANESVRLLTNLTVTDSGVNMVVNDSTILPLFFKMVELPNPKLKLIVDYVMSSIGNISVTSINLRDMLLNQYNILGIIRSMAANPIILEQSSKQLCMAICSICYLDQPSLPIAQIREIIKITKTYFMDNPINIRYICKFLGLLTQHQDFVLSIITDYQLDYFILETISQNLDVDNEDWNYVLIYSTKIMMEIAKHERGNNSTIFSFSRSVVHLKQMITTRDNYQLMDAVLSLLFEYSHFENVDSIIKSGIINDLTVLLKFDYDYNQKGEVYIEKKVKIDLFIAGRLLFFILGIVIQAPTQDQLLELIQQGLLLVFSRIFPVLSTPQLLNLYKELFERMVEGLDDNHRLLLRAHFAKLDFLSLTTNNPNPQVQFIRDYIISDSSGNEDLLLYSLSPPI